jgi:hypothetical protein
MTAFHDPPDSKARNASRAVRAKAEREWKKKELGTHEVFSLFGYFFPPLLFSSI